MTTTNRTNFASGAGLSRRALLAGAGATGLALAGGRRAFAAGAENTLKVGFISPRTGALGGFGETDGYVLDVVRKSLASGFAVGDKTFDGEDSRSGHPVRPVARRPARQGADQLRQDRPDAGRLDARR